ncbi:hypothetical protein [Vitiosangium sp. GDMCC 1.1324]|uniref:hypothetical protein n=1 Tax=Vitiosangium sp. (strain GDMCC 1.1324) TaxID=2138576 RepID=UPI000D3C74D6|nr:hypothetical protein [Vitiosangium sp. GDMCC 1.1324]PTL85213.1 hypothetical protein DAT35_00335 [Vitiosangium sp. GDMCC 1.1324]
MAIVSIGEVVGSVQGAPGQPERPSTEQVPTEQQAAESRPTHAEDVQRELRMRAWRRTRLHAD